MRACQPDLPEPNIYGFEIKKIQDLRKSRCQNTLFGKDIRSKLFQGTIGAGASETDHHEFSLLLDFLERVLRINPKERPEPHEALMHPFFKRPGSKYPPKVKQKHKQSEQPKPQRGQPGSCPNNINYFQTDSQTSVPLFSTQRQYVYSQQEVYNCMTYQSYRPPILNIPLETIKGFSNARLDFYLAPPQMPQQMFYPQYPMNNQMMAYYPPPPGFPPPQQFQPLYTSTQNIWGASSQWPSYGGGTFYQQPGYGVGLQEHPPYPTQMYIGYQQQMQQQVPYSGENQGQSTFHPGQGQFRQRQNNRYKPEPKNHSFYHQKKGNSLPSKIEHQETHKRPPKISTRGFVPQKQYQKRPVQDTTQQDLERAMEILIADQQSSRSARYENKKGNFWKNSEKTVTKFKSPGKKKIQMDPKVPATEPNSARGQQPGNKPFQVPRLQQTQKLKVFYRKIEKSEKDERNKEDQGIQDIRKRSQSDQCTINNEFLKKEDEGKQPRKRANSEEVAQEEWKEKEVPATSRSYAEHQLKKFFEGDVSSGRTMSSSNSKSSLEHEDTLKPKLENSKIRHVQHLLTKETSPRLMEAPAYRRTNSFASNIKSKTPQINLAELKEIIGTSLTPLLLPESRTPVIHRIDQVGFVGPGKNLIGQRSSRDNFFMKSKKSGKELKTLLSQRISSLQKDSSESNF